MPPDEARISPPATAGVEYELAGKVHRGHSRLDSKGRLVFLGPGHVVAVPLPTEAARVGVASQARNAAHDRPSIATNGADECIDRITGGSQRATASGASH